MTKKSFICIWLLFTSIYIHAQPRMVCNADDFLLYGFGNEIDLSDFTFDSVDVAPVEYWHLKSDSSPKVLIVYPGRAFEITVKLYFKKKMFKEQTFKVHFISRKCVAEIQVLKSPTDKPNPEDLPEEPYLLTSDSTHYLKIDIYREQSYLNLRFPEDNKFIINDLQIILVENKKAIKMLNFRNHSSNIYDLSELKGLLSPSRKILLEIKEVQPTSWQGSPFHKSIQLSKSIFNIPIYKDQDSYLHFMKFGE